MLYAQCYLLAFKFQILLHQLLTCMKINLLIIHFWNNYNIENTYLYPLYNGRLKIRKSYGYNKHYYKMKIQYMGTQ